MTQIENDPMYTALQALIVARRLTGDNMKFDDIPLSVDGENDVDPDNRIVWRDDGFSVQQSEWGGRMSRAVEEVRKNTKDELAAKALPQYFAQIPLLDDNTSDQAKHVARMNQQYIHVVRRLTGRRSSRAVARMQEYSPAHYVKGTTDPEWRDLPRYEVDPAPRGSRSGAYIANHRICVGEAWQLEDVWTNEQLSEWAANWVKSYADGTLGPEVL